MVLLLYGWYMGIKEGGSNEVGVLHVLYVGRSLVF